MRNSTIRAYAAGILTGALGAAAIVYAAAPAHAAPDIDGAAGAFAVVYGQIICDSLDRDDSDTTIEALALAINQEGLTFRQAGQAMVIAVDNYCPRHLDVLRAYATANTTSAAIA